MLWSPDAAIEAARKLPEWGAFHRLCQPHGLAFDDIRKNGRRYQARAVKIIRTEMGGYCFEDLGLGEGKGVVEAVSVAYAGCGITVPGAPEMLGRGLTGVIEDEFGALLDDDFGDLLL